MKAGKAQKHESILTYELLVMTVTHALTHAFLNIHLALFPIFMKEFDLSLHQLGIIAAIPSICQTILYIPTGLLADRFGPKKMIIMSLSVAILGALIASQKFNFLKFILAVSLLYTSTTIYHPSAYNFTSQQYSLSDRPKAMSILDMAGPLGISFGPISVSILVGIFDYKWQLVYLFWLVPLLFGILAVLKIRYETKNMKKKIHSKIKSRTKDPPFLTLSLVMFLIFRAFKMMSRRMVGSFLPIYLIDERELNNFSSNIVYGGGSLIALIAVPIGGLLASRFGEKRWLLTGLFLMFVSLAIAVAIPNIFAFLVFYILYLFFNYLGMSANSSIVSLISPIERRGLGYSLFFLPSSVMGAVAPLIAANIADTWGLNSIFIAALAVHAFGIAVLKLGVKISPLKIK